MRLSISALICCCLSFVALPGGFADDDYIARLQAKSVTEDVSIFGHWGLNAQKYSSWTNHSNRLVPVYTYGTRTAKGGVNLRSYTGKNSPYRSETSVRKIYGRIPERTVSETAVWMDQTNIADIQRAAAEAGRKYIFLVIFDGMDWDTTRSAAIYNEKSVGYRKGKGSGTHFQNYTANDTSQYGFMVTSPHNNGTTTDVNAQKVSNPGGTLFGGYDPKAGGFAPWQEPSDRGYLISKPSDGNVKHAYTDSASSATSMTAGIKTYNAGIGVDFSGAPVSTIAHDLQAEDWAVGVVSSVPISHATPAAAYAHNVTRKDYQDISRDLLGIPSVSHPTEPMPGLDVVLGGGFGKRRDADPLQGDNYQPGNFYLADTDLKASSIENGGRYVTAVRTAGQSGPALLDDAVRKAVTEKHRLLGFFGVGEYDGHLPFQTANGDFKPVRGVPEAAESYSSDVVDENPTIADLTDAAIQVLESRADRFWLMVEAGDVDWASHDNNIDDAIGAVNSGDAAVKVVTDWVEANSSWDESLMIVTADHGHLFWLTRPELLTGNRNDDKNSP